MKKQPISLALLLAVAFSASSPALAESYKLRSYNPGMKSSAGALNANPANPSNPAAPVEPPPVPNSVLEFTSATPINLGTIQRGAPNGVVVDVTAKNGDVELKNYAFNGAYIPPFSVTANTCSSLLPKDQTCSVSISLDTLATTPGVKEGTAFAIEYLDNKSNTRFLSSLTLANVLFGNVRFATENQIYPAQDVNTVGQPLTTELNNNGTGLLTINGITPPAGFLTHAVSCDTETGVKTGFPVTLRSHLDSNDVCRLSFKFAPTAPISYSGTLAVDSDSYTNAVTYTMTGVGQTPIDYATMINSGYQSNVLTMSNGNLTGTWPTNTANHSLYRTNKVRSSGKYYVEFTTNNLKALSVGVMRNPASITRGVGYFGTDFGFWDGHAAFLPTTPRTKTPNVVVTTLENWAVPASTLSSVTVGMKIDLDTGRLALVGQDCTEKSVMTLGTLGTHNFAPAIMSSPYPGSSFTANMGQFPMTCPVPAGFNKGWF